jgi:hypothetical protein
MRLVSRSAALVATTLVVAVAGAPAFAAGSPTQPAAKPHHTSVNARASKGVVAPKHTDTVNVTLHSGKSAVAGEESNFVVRSRRDVSNTAQWGNWAAVAASAGAVDGHYTISVTLPARLTKGQKEQFQVKFAGDAANNLASSRSQVFTLKAK